MQDAAGPRGPTLCTPVLNRSSLAERLQKATHYMENPPHLQAMHQSIADSKPAPCGQPDWNHSCRGSRDRSVTGLEVLSLFLVWSQARPCISKGAKLCRFGIVKAYTCVQFSEGIFSQSMNVFCWMLEKYVSPKWLIQGCTHSLQENPKAINCFSPTLLHLNGWE